MSHGKFSLILACLVAAWSLSSSLFAQQEGAGEGGIALTAAPSGIRRFTPGEWSGMIVQGMNGTDAEATGTIAVYFDQESQFQFARRMWLPAKSVRTTWLPIRAPGKLELDKDSMTITLMPLTESAGQEVLRRRANQELLPTVLVSADLDAVTTVGFFRRAPFDPAGYSSDPDRDAYEMMALAREMAEFPRIILDLPWDFVPPHPAMWQSIDQFILCGDAILNDTAGLAALRDWLFRGGRLCVFLDRTSPATVSAILGHGDHFRVVDRVELDDFTIVGQGTQPGQLVQDRRRLETPVEFVRVIADAADVSCRVDGWPAAFWLPAGNGEVLLMALAPDGWRPAPIQPGWESLPEHRDMAYRGLSNLQGVASRFYVARDPEPKVDEVVRPILQQQIGYRVPGRGLAAGILGLNMLGLIAGGAWLARRRQLDRMAYLLPAVTLLAAAVFVVVGSINNRGVPTSAAFAQLVRHHPEVESSHVLGLAAMYQQETRPWRITAGPAGLLVPQVRPADGTTQRLVWGDANRGEWSGLELPAGSVQFASYEQAVAVGRQVVARASFAAGGLAGVLQGVRPASPPDALVAAFPAPNSGVELRPDGTFVVPPEGVFSSGQFLAGSVVSDTSRRRQEAYRRLLSQAGVSRFVERPTLLVWTDPQPEVIQVPEDTARRGSALAAIPLWIERTPSGTRFSVPSTFLRMTSVTGEQGISLAYDSRRGQWLTDASRATNTRLRFQLPPSVLPCQVTEAKITIRLNAPSRELLVHAVVDHKDTLMERIENPSGVYQFVVDRSEWLQLDERGGLHFTFAITEAEQERARQEAVLKQAKESERRRRGELPAAPEDPAANATSFATWEIHYVRMEVRGKTD